jgi:hypothetical protein
MPYGIRVRIVPRDQLRAMDQRWVDTTMCGYAHGVFGPEIEADKITKERQAAIDLGTKVVETLQKTNGADLELEITKNQYDYAADQLVEVLKKRGFFAKKFGASFEKEQCYYLRVSVVSA